MKTAEEMAEEILGAHWDDLSDEKIKSLVAQALSAYADERVKEMKVELEITHRLAQASDEACSGYAKERNEFEQKYSALCVEVFGEVLKARAEALEEAAKIAEEIGCLCMECVCDKNIRDEIRALKEPKP